MRVVPLIKTSGIESQGQKEAAACASSSLCDRCHKIFTWVAALNFKML